MDDQSIITPIVVGDLVRDKYETNRAFVVLNVLGKAEGVIPMLEIKPLDNLSGNLVFIDVADAYSKTSLAELIL